MVLLARKTDRTAAAIDDMHLTAMCQVLRDRNPHGSAADMAMSREEIRRVLTSRSSSDARHDAVLVAPKQQMLTRKDELAFQTLNHAMQYLMNRVPMGGPDTVFADIQHGDMQAAAILAGASRELFLPKPTPRAPEAPRFTFRDRLRAMAAHLGLHHAGQSGSVISLR
jgi:hypothetical protein